MRAKEYLSQIRIKNAMINVWIQEKEELWQRMMSLNSPRYDGVSVQSTKDPDRYGNMMARISQKEEKINQEIDDLVKAKEKIMGEIREITDERFVEILMRRYVSCQKLEDIAREMHYAHGWVRQLHGQALIEFEQVHPEIADL